MEDITMPRKKTTEAATPEVKNVVEPADPGVAEEKAEKAPKKKEVSGTKVTVIPARLNVRKRPDAYAPVITILDANEELIVDQFDPSKDWTSVKITIKDKTEEGFVMTRFLRA